MHVSGKTPADEGAPQADPNRPDPTARTTPPAAQRGLFRAVLARDGWAVLLAVAATVVVEVGAYALAVAGQAPRAQAALGSLAVSILWVALAAPVLAATARGTLGALLRGGAVIDASAVLLGVLWLAGQCLTLLGGLKVYCILAAMGLAGVAPVCLARSPAGRFALAAAASATLLLAAATPFWIGGALRAAPEDWARRIAAAGVYVNPFYAVTGALAESAQFIWHQASVLYRITRLGDYAPAPAPAWYAPVLLFSAAAVLLGAAAMLRSRLK
jgi:hypothetical protein